MNIISNLLCDGRVMENTPRSILAESLRVEEQNLSRIVEFPSEFTANFFLIIGMQISSQKLDLPGGRVRINITNYLDVLVLCCTDEDNLFARTYRGVCVSCGGGGERQKESASFI